MSCFCENHNSPFKRLMKSATEGARILNFYARVKGKVQELHICMGIMEENQN